MNTDFFTDLRKICSNHAAAAHDHYTYTKFSNKKATANVELIQIYNFITLDLINKKIVFVCLDHRPIYSTYLRRSADTKRLKNAGPEYFL